jgi:hypothetical protein
VPEEEPVLDVHGRPIIDPAGQPLKLRDRP